MTWASAPVVARGREGRRVANDETEIANHNADRQLERKRGRARPLQQAVSPDRQNIQRFVVAAPISGCSPIFSCSSFKIW